MVSAKRFNGFSRWPILFKVKLPELAGRARDLSTHVGKSVEIATTCPIYPTDVFFVIAPSGYYDSCFGGQASRQKSDVPIVDVLPGVG